MHELNPYWRALGRLEGLEPQPRTSDPFHGAVILLHDVIEILYLVDGDRSAVLSVAALNSSGTGFAAIDREARRHTVAAGALGEKAQSRPLVQLLCQEHVDGLPHPIHGAIQVAPSPSYADVGFIHAPTAPHRPFAAMARRFKRRGILQDPPMNGRINDHRAALLHELFQLPMAQRVRHLPTHACQDDVLLEVGTLEADHDLSRSTRHG